MQTKSLQIWEMQKKNENNVKKCEKNAKKMTPVLAKLRFWIFQVGSGSSHPRRTRKRQEHEKTWQKNDNEMQNQMTKKWQRKTEMTNKTKWQKKMAEKQQK